MRRASMRLARARGAGEQHGRLALHRHALHLVDQRVEARVAGGNAAFQELHRVLLLATCRRWLITS
jgi:hypothetical protein